MGRKEELEGRLAGLREELGKVEGTPTEVYSRIVGYYRSVRNWNAGKREEYCARRSYALPRSLTMAPAPSAAPAAVAPAPAPAPAAPVALQTALAAGLPARDLPLKAGGRAAAAKSGELALGDDFSLESKGVAARSGILVFTRKKCPNCPPVADFVTRAGLPAVFVDVDGEEGLALARRHGVMATPTVLGLDGEGRESFRAYGLGELKARLPGVAGAAVTTC